MGRRVLLSAAALVAAAFGVTAQQPSSQPAPAPPGQTTPAPGRSTNLGADPNGNPLRLALKTGHVSNYDEAKVPAYNLPDPLVMVDGKPVKDARTWQARRAEILRLYEAEIYGRIPATTPKVSWQVTETDPQAREGTAVRKKIVGTMGTAADAPKINLTLHTPVNAKGPVPVILLVNFGGGTPPPAPPVGAAAGRGRGPGFPTDPPVAADIIARGWGYATVGYQDIQPDRLNTWNEGVIGRTLTPGQTAPAPEEWGTIGAWSWGISRILDYFETDQAVNARQVAVHGHSRLGKTVLWASARDERIAAVFSSCSGEMGAALARRDWGETVDDMAQNFPWQFAGNFQKWAGRWNDMPVDAHMLIALSAPRPVFVTGGTTDQWADPVGMFKAEVAAGPVYRLLGKKDLGTTELPGLDMPLTGGDLGWHYHTGGHTATPADWTAFLQFLGKYFK
jgi:(4-O-methyl)-D-glucuronate---lignin esterase